MLDKLMELYHATESCKQGNCNRCCRKNLFNSSDTYSCKSKLLSDCHSLFGEMINVCEEYLNN